jgi:hypothetical protein
MIFSLACREALHNILYNMLHDSNAKSYCSCGG